MILIYNKVLVANKDLHKITFITKWGTFTYKTMFLGMINAGTIFQRVMDTTFRRFINRSVVIYMDNITVFLNKHLK